MKNLNLQQTQFEILANILKHDIADLAEDPRFLEDGSHNPQKYIDERIALCRLFEFDFWDSIDLYCNHYSLERLKALYEGKSTKSFNEDYTLPNPQEIEKGFLKAIIKNQRKK